MPSQGRDDRQVWILTPFFLEHLDDPDGMLVIPESALAYRYLFRLLVYTSGFLRKAVRDCPSVDQNAHPTRVVKKSIGGREKKCLSTPHLPQRQ